MSTKAASVSGTNGADGQDGVDGQDGGASMSFGAQSTGNATSTRWFWPWANTTGVATTELKVPLPTRAPTTKCKIRLCWRTIGTGTGQVTITLHKNGIATAATITKNATDAADTLFESSEFDVALDPGTDLVSCAVITTSTITVAPNNPMATFVFY